MNRQGVSFPLLPFVHLLGPVGHQAARHGSAEAGRGLSLGIPSLHLTICVSCQGWTTPAGESALRPFHETRQYVDVSIGIKISGSRHL